jgi:hypothetical protein
MGCQGSEIQGNTEEYAYSWGKRNKKYVQKFCGKSSARSMTEDNNRKMVLGEGGCKNGTWVMELVQDHVRWWSLVSVVLNFQFLLPQKQLNIKTIQLLPSKYLSARCPLLKRIFILNLQQLQKKTNVHCN